MTQEYIKNAQNADDGQHYPRILFVFEDVVLHSLKERQVFEPAKQPCSSVNIINELMTNTGVFDRHEITTLMSFDRDSSSLMFKGDEA